MIEIDYEERQPIFKWSTENLISLNDVSINNIVNTEIKPKVKEMRKLYKKIIRDVDKYNNIYEDISKLESGIFNIVFDEGLEVNYEY